MRRGRILALTTTAIVLAGMATAGAAVHHDDGAVDKERAAEPLAAHNQYLGSPVDVPAGSFAFATVNCPAGQVPTGGGATTSGTFNYLTDSLATATGWEIGVRNTGTASQTVRAFVICTVP